MRLFEIFRKAFGPSTYAGALFTFGLLLGAVLVGVALYPAARTLDPFMVLFFTAITFLAELVRVPLPFHGFISVGSTTILATMIVLGPGGAAFAAAVGMGMENLLRRRKVPVFLFNVCQISLSAAMAGLTYRALLAWMPPGPELLVQLLSLLGGSLVYFHINAMSVTLSIALEERVPFSLVWWRNVRWSALTYLLLAPFALLIAEVYSSAMGPLGVLLLLAPLFTSRFAWDEYMKMREAHMATVQSLAAALDAKDRYTRGHSERVAQMAEAVAQRMGLAPRVVETVRDAGLLHDVGKIGVRETILNKGGSLDDEELRFMRSHPEMGEEMIRPARFLHEVAQIVRHHHEWYNGIGYPDGLKGDEIPIGARIISVVDAFDAMTTNRAYRAALSPPEAVERLQRNRGSQFDPKVVDVFVRYLVEERPDLLQGGTPPQVLRPVAPARSAWLQPEEIKLSSARPSNL